MYAIEEISTHELRAAGEADATWGTVEPRIGIDYTDYTSVIQGLGLLELDADGLYMYRIIERATDEQSYQELEAENLDALEAMTAWVDAGCPRTGEEIEALRRAAMYRDGCAPIKVVTGTTAPKKERAA